jgi:hypothetical protein
MLISPAVLQPLQGLTVLRADHANVIARDERDNQEFVLAECSSPAIAGCLLALIRHASGGQDEQR